MEDPTPVTPPKQSALRSFRIAQPERWITFLLCIAATTWLFMFYGSDSDVANEPTSIFKWISMQWAFENWKNNWIMLIVAAYVIFFNRKKLAETESSYSAIALLVLAGSLATHIIAYRSQLPRLSCAAVVGVYWSVAWAIWGWKIARILWFPAAYSLLCFCSSLLMDVTMPLRLMASQLACFFLHGVGIQAVNQGTVVYSTAGGGFQFDVADACSGLRSLIVMTALAAPYAYISVRGTWRQMTLFAMSVPLAMLANALRIFSLAVVAEVLGMKLAMTLYHDLSGYIVFFLAIGLLIVTARILEIDWRKKLCAIKFKKRSLARQP